MEMPFEEPSALVSVFAVESGNQKTGGDGTVRPVEKTFRVILVIYHQCAGNSSGQAVLGGVYHHVQVSQVKVNIPQLKVPAGGNYRFAVKRLVERTGSKFQIHDF